MASIYPKVMKREAFLKERGLGVDDVNNDRPVIVLLDDDLNWQAITLEDATRLYQKLGAFLVKNAPKG